jgi:hypothetical protein
MTAFSTEIITDDLPDRIYVKVDDVFDIAIIRTPEGIEVRVYPITKGETWIDPYDTYIVEESDILRLEQPAASSQKEAAI